MQSLILIHPLGLLTVLLRLVVIMVSSTILILHVWASTGKYSIVSRCRILSNIVHLVCGGSLSHSFYRGVVRCFSSSVFIAPFSNEFFAPTAAVTTSSASVLTVVSQSSSPTTVPLSVVNGGIYLLTYILFCVTLTLIYIPQVVLQANVN